MGKASRAKRKRAAVRAAKRSRNNSWWYGITALVVIIGVGLVVYARETAPASVGPYISDKSLGPAEGHNADSHWHAALGVYDCDHWLGDTPGSGIWQWPGTTTAGISRVGTQVYAGMHSHNDGLIHMEPAASEEAGRNATVGKYFEYGGWKLSATGYDFLGTKVQNGDKCAKGGAGTLQWELAKWNDTQQPQKYTVEKGNPADYKLYNKDIVVIAFLPAGKSITTLENPPSVAKLPNPAEGGSTATTLPPVVVPTTVARTTPTTKAASATTVHKP